MNPVDTIKNILRLAASFYSWNNCFASKRFSNLPARPSARTEKGIFCKNGSRFAENKRNKNLARAGKFSFTFKQGGLRIHNRFWVLAGDGFGQNENFFLAEHLSDTPVRFPAIPCRTPPVRFLAIPCWTPRSDSWQYPVAPGTQRSILLWMRPTCTMVFRRWPWQ